MKRRFNWKFWTWGRKRRPPMGDTDKVGGHPNCRCFIIGVDPGRHFAECGAQIAQEVMRRYVVGETEAKVLENLGHRIAIEYNPDRRGSYCWTVAFDLDYTFRGSSFGPDGPALARECGLMFPNDRTPWVGSFSLKEDGRFEWYCQERPSTRQIVAVVQDAQAQVRELMQAYWFNLKAELVRRKGPNNG